MNINEWQEYKDARPKVGAWVVVDHRDGVCVGKVQNDRGEVDCAGIPDGEVYMVDGDRWIEIPSPEL